MQNNFAKDSARLMEMHRAAETGLILGWEIVTNHRSDPGGFIGILFAQRPDGKVFSRITQNPDEFHHHAAIWHPVSDEYLEKYGEEMAWVGTYENKIKVKETQ